MIEKIPFWSLSGILYQTSRIKKLFICNNDFNRSLVMDQVILFCESICEKASLIAYASLQECLKVDNDKLFEKIMVFIMNYYQTPEESLGRTLLNFNHYGKSDRVISFYKQVLNYDPRQDSILIQFLNTFNYNNIEMWEYISKDLDRQHPLVIGSFYHGCQSPIFCRYHHHKYGFNYDEIDIEQLLPYWVVYPESFVFHNEIYQLSDDVINKLIRRSLDGYAFRTFEYLMDMYPNLTINFHRQLIDTILNLIYFHEQEKEIVRRIFRKINFREDELANILTARD